MAELRKYLFKKVMNIDSNALDRPVRESLRDKAKNLSNQVVSRIKHKQSVNILLIGASGTGKQLIIDQAVQAARDQGLNFFLTFERFLLIPFLRKKLLIDDFSGRCKSDKNIWPSELKGYFERAGI